ncbi:MAG: DUF3349 domain-containing protein [Actinobacteria bacterium]|nr:DUF3349 domain-containing protein [Actinomycetota bacterium]
MPLPPFLTSVVEFLRKGYPEGVPARDYIPLFALLRRQLTTDEANAVADELATASDPATAEQIRQAITAVTREEPSEQDIARVSARLAAGGWPLASPSRTDSTARD